MTHSMYLMTMFFITGAYQEVYKMVESCVSEDLTPEEVRGKLLVARFLSTFGGLSYTQ